MIYSENINQDKIDMFADFIEVLEPHLENASINMQNMKKDLVNKYKKEDGEEVI